LKTFGIILFSAAAAYGKPSYLSKYFSGDIHGSLTLFAMILDRKNPLVLVSQAVSMLFNLDHGFGADLFTA
jgi:hypothetical protein